MNKETSNYDKIKMEVTRLLDEMTKVDPSSDDYKDLQDRCKTLQAMLRDEDEVSLKSIEIGAKEEMAKKDRILGYVKCGVEIAIVGIGTVASFAMYKSGLEFETEGTVTSTLFRSFLNKKIR